MLKVEKIDLEKSNKTPKRMRYLNYKNHKNLGFESQNITSTSDKNVLVLNCIDLSHKLLKNR